MNVRQTQEMQCRCTQGCHPDNFKGKEDAPVEVDGMDHGKVGIEDDAQSCE